MNEMILIPMIPVFVSAFLIEWLYTCIKSGNTNLTAGKPFWLARSIRQFFARRGLLRVWRVDERAICRRIVHGGLGSPLFLHPDERRHGRAGIFFRNSVTTGITVPRIVFVGSGPSMCLTTPARS
ncbi:hypothetical protein UMZ34_13510 [Halopseudomonas pachastrellae]|nr:hypothetical protein UMZ34_13510 [Halopseudomonas pachastrellae]